MHESHKPEGSHTPVASFANAIAHDFNNLLTVISSVNDTVLITAADRLTPTEVEMIKEVLVATKTGATLTRQLMALMEESDPDKPSPLEGFSIALLDDKAVLVQSLAWVLRQWGCTVLAATDCSQARTAIGLASRVPDLMISDGELIESAAGRDLTQWLQIHAPAMPAVLMWDEWSEKSDQPGTLRRPFTKSQVLDAIETSVAPALREAA